MNILSNMKKAYFFLILVLFVFIFNCVLFASGGMTSTQETMRGISGESVQKTQIYVTVALVLIFFVVTSYAFYKFHKENKIRQNDTKVKKSLRENNIGCYCQILFIIIVIYIIYLSISKTDKLITWQDRQKACYSNIRMIQRAVERYNTEAVPQMTATNNASLYMRDVNIKLLIDKGYLKTVPKCPENNENTYNAFGDLYYGGEVGCGDRPIGGTADNPKKYHGTLSGKGSASIKMD